MDDAARTPLLRGPSKLTGFWLAGVGTGGVAYLIAEGAGEEVSGFELGSAVVLFASPFFLATLTLIARWPAIRGRLASLAAIWGIGAGAVVTAWLLDRHFGPEAPDLLVLLCRLLTLLGPALLALVTLAWLLDRWLRPAP